MKIKLNKTKGRLDNDLINITHSDKNTFSLLMDYCIDGIQYEKGSRSGELTSSQITDLENLKSLAQQIIDFLDDETNEPCATIDINEHNCINARRDY